MKLSFPICDGILVWEPVQTHKHILASCCSVLLKSFHWSVMGAIITLSLSFFPHLPISCLYFLLFLFKIHKHINCIYSLILLSSLYFLSHFFPIFSFFLTSAAQKGLLHLSPDIYQEMEASRKQGGNAPSSGPSSGSSVTYMPSKDMGPCSAPLPPGHPQFYSGTASSPSPTATMARELLLNGQSPTTDTSLPMKGTNPGLACGVSVQPAQQLDYLARIQGFQVRAKTVVLRYSLSQSNIFLDNLHVERWVSRFQVMQMHLMET